MDQRQLRINDIKNSILGFNIYKDYIDVEFDDFYLEVDIDKFKGNIDMISLAEVIYKYY